MDLFFGSARRLNEEKKMTPSRESRWAKESSLPKHRIPTVGALHCQDIQRSVAAAADREIFFQQATAATDG